MQIDPIHNKSAMRILRLVLAGGLTLSGAAYAADAPKADMAKADSAAKPAAAAGKPDKNALKAAQTAVQNAIAALQKEYQAHVKDPKTALRDKSNYFTENPSTDILPETIVQALGSTLNPDPVGDSYIKWQLLSGVPGKFDDQLAPLAAAAYSKAAKPPVRPGLSQADKRQLDPLTRDVHTADESVALTKKLSELVDPWEARIKTLVSYRDDLYAKLPMIPEALVGRLDDLKSRVEAGIDSEVLLKSVIGDITSWVATNPPAAHLYVMVERVKTLTKGGGGGAKPANNTPGGKGMGKYANAGSGGGGMQQFPPKYYDHVEFDSTSKQWKWADQGTKLARGTVLTDFLVTLEDSAKTSTNKGMASDTPAKDTMKK